MRRSGVPLKVLYLIDGLGHGGAERSLAELLPWYLAAGVRPLVVCQREHEGRNSELVREHGCEIRVLAGNGFFGRARALRRIISTERPDLVHTTLYNSDVLGRVAAAGTGVPVLTSLVNTTYEPARLGDPNVGRLALRFAKALDGWSARRLTSHFHAITEAVKQSAVRHLRVPGEKITVVERGRTADRLGSPSPARRAEARRRLGIAPDAEIVLNVARQEYQKGQKHLLEATGLLAASRPKLIVLIAGREGHSSAELAGIREGLGLGDRLRFLGNRDDVPELLAAADVFVFPSLYEGLGGSVIEAMALGLPIVASDLPALREVVEDGRNALLVPPASASALAQALRRLLDDDPLRASFGVRSARIFAERFTIERSAARMIALYHQVSGFPSRHPGTQAARGGTYVGQLGEPIERLHP